MARIFLCYRSDDGAYAAALIDEMLSQVYGPYEVFRASRCIAPGESYPEAIRAALRVCECMLVLVGPRWVNLFKQYGSGACSSEPEAIDWVRHEIATAITSNIKIVPVILADAQRPRATELPADIRSVAQRQNVCFRHRNLRADFDRLVDALRLNLVHKADPWADPLRIGSTFAMSSPQHDLPDTGVVMRSEMCADGMLEVEAVTRDEFGQLVSRVGGRVRSTDLVTISRLLEGLGSGATSTLVDVCDGGRNGRISS